LGLPKFVDVFFVNLEFPRCSDIEGMFVPWTSISFAGSSWKLALLRFMGLAMYLSLSHFALDIVLSRLSIRFFFPFLGF
jgi:hypothetical protein